MERASVQPVYTEELDSVRIIESWPEDSYHKTMVKLYVVFDRKAGTTHRWRVQVVEDNGAYRHERDIYVGDNRTKALMLYKDERDTAKGHTTYWREGNIILKMSG